MTKSTFVLSFVLAGFASAQSLNMDIRLGLWEATTTSQTNGRPQIDTSKMTPEVRQRVEEALKGRPDRGPSTSTARDCLTKEKLEKNMFFNPKQMQDACKRTIVSNTRTVAEVKFECPNEKMPYSGTLRFEALSRESVKGTFTMGTNGMNSAGTMTAKWISDSCGDQK